MRYEGNKAKTNYKLFPFVIIIFIGVVIVVVAAVAVFDIVF